MLVLLNLDRQEYLRLDRAARAGDVAAADTIADMWSEYTDTDLECFICAQPVPKPVFAVIVPDYDDAKLLACPCCPACRRLPVQLRTHKMLKLLRAMWSKRFKHDVHFTFNRAARQPHPR